MTHVRRGPAASRPLSKLIYVHKSSPSNSPALLTFQLTPLGCDPISCWNFLCNK